MSFSRKKIWYLLLFVLAISIFFRTIYPRADFPIELSWSNAPTQDATWYTATAVQKAMGHPPVSYGFSDRHIDRPFFTWYCYLLYLLFGVNFATNTLISAIPGTLSVFLIFHLLRTHHHSKIWGSKGGLIGAYLLGFNFVAIVYCRIPLLYTSISCYCLVVMWLWLKGAREKPIYFALAWLVLLAGFYWLKVLVGTLAPALVMGHIYDLRDRGILDWDQVLRLVKRIKWFLVAVGAMGLVVLWVTYDRHFIAYVLHMYTSKLSPQSYPKPSTTLMHFLEYGSTSRLLIRAPSLMFFASVASIFIVLKKNKRPLEVVAVTWLLVLVVGTLPLKYRPLRFVSLLLPVAALVSGILFAYLLELFERGSPFPKLGWKRKIAAYGMALTVGTWIVYHVFREGKKWTLGFDVLNPVLLIEWAQLNHLIYFRHFLFAFGISMFLGGVFVLANRSRWYGAIRYAVGGGMALVLVSGMVWNGYQILSYLRTPLYSQTQANREMPLLVGKKAYVAGSYAHALTLETDLRRMSIFKIDVTKTSSKRVRKYMEQSQKHVSTNPLNVLHFIYRGTDLEVFDPSFAKAFREWGYTHLAMPQNDPPVDMVISYFERAGHEIIKLRTIYLRGWEAVLMRVCWDSDDPGWHVGRALAMKQRYEKQIQLIHRHSQQISRGPGIASPVQHMSFAVDRAIAIMLAGGRAKEALLKGRSHLRKMEEKWSFPSYTPYERGVLLVKVGEWFTDIHRQSLRVKVASPVKLEASYRYYTRAARLLENYFEANPDCSSSLLLRGLCLQRVRRFGQAEKCFQAAIETNPYDGVAYQNLANYYQYVARLQKGEEKMETLRKAFQALLKARRLCPRDLTLEKRGRSLSQYMKTISSREK